MKKRDKDPVFVTKTCYAYVCDKDGRRFEIGDIKLTEEEPGPKDEQFADAAFKRVRASLVRLQVPNYRIIIRDGQKESGYGLERWIKLVDGRKLYEDRLRGAGKKQSVRKTARV